MDSVRKQALIEWNSDEGGEEDKIPAPYLIQCQHYIAVTGFEISNQGK
jgi:predicted phage-related endonuclease